jgi:uncharacterized Zn finger protein
MARRRSSKQLPRTKKGSGPVGLRGFLARLDKDRLVDLLFAQAMNDDRLYRRLDLERSKGSGPGAHLAAIRQTLSSAFDFEDDYFYEEDYGYAESIQEAVDVVEDLLRQGQATEVIDLAEYALALAEQASQHVSDSDGELYMAMERLQGLHLAACKKARPDPEALARRLFAFEVETGSDPFYGAAETYARILGKKGRAAYRELAEAEWEKFPPRAPGDDWRFDAKRSRLAHVLESLAKAAGDLEALVAVKSRDLSRAGSFLEIAQIYEQAGKKDLALEWAEKGVRAFPKATDRGLRRFLAAEYRARRRDQEAIALIWANFTDGPALEEYQELKKYSERTGAWPEWREKALGVLRDLARKALVRFPSQGAHFGYAGGPASRLVEILLWEKKLEDAWKEAQQLGCSEDLWLVLAKHRERTHPEEALTVYQRQVESALQRVSQEGYQTAVARLRQVKDVMVKLGKTRDFAAYLASLRLAHKRKRNFLQLLDRARLG